jgi:predicted nucleic acid-binding protein
MNSSTDKTFVVVGDADSLIAQLHKYDANHAKASKIGRALKKNNADIVFPITAISETITVLKFRKTDARAIETLTNATTSKRLHVEDITFELFKKAAELFDPQSSKRNTFFDAIVGALAKKINADAIFSFDGWYKKKGFKLASEIV